MIDSSDEKLLPVFEPMPGKIVAQVVGERGVYGTGLIVKPSTVRNPRTTAIVIAIYEPFLLDQKDDRETEAFVKVGDTIIFGMHSGIEIEYGAEKVIILREQEILTKVKLRNPDDISKMGVATEGTFDDIEG
jgi:co-chaperonin GroES (HSP10)